jgi:myo-inositol-1(or 4)-monophosphatase
VADDVPFTSEAATELAATVARDAGSLLLHRYFRSSSLAVTAKAGVFVDVVTEADHAAHHRIIELLQASRPGDRVVTEEGSAEPLTDIGSESQLVWTVDPLDGTINFVKGQPHWCVSIAAADSSGVTVAGAVYDPSRDEMFTATLGAGAFLNGVRLRVSPIAAYRDSTVVTSMMAGPDHRAFQTQVLAEVSAGCAGSRSLWSPALDLAWVACGRVEAFLEYSVSAWDTDAAQLMVDEAGGCSQPWSWDRYAGHAAANNPAVLQAMMDALARA